MYGVEVKNPCRCFFRSGMAERQSFATKEEAAEEAERMVEEMRTHFCHKHIFRLTEQLGNYTITIVSS